MKETRNSFLKILKEKLEKNDLKQLFAFFNKYFLFLINIYFIYIYLENYWILKVGMFIILNQNLKDK